jgi:hypothetical protein
MYSQMSLPGWPTDMQRLPLDPETPILNHVAVHSLNQHFPRANKRTRTFLTHFNFANKNILFMGTKSTHIAFVRISCPFLQELLVS